MYFASAPCQIPLTAGAATSVRRDLRDDVTHLDRRRRFKRSGVLARFVEGWKAGWIVNLISGAAATLSAQSMLYASGTPECGRAIRQVGRWSQLGSGANATSGNYFASRRI